jgi:YD repeat-containing protein
MKRFIHLLIISMMTLIANAQVITANSILENYQNAAQNENSEFCYNVEMSDGRITTQYVYRKVGDNGTELRPSIQYQYEYDSADRLLSRTKLRWDNVSKKWQTDSRLDYNYTADSFTVETRKWNDGKRQYGQAINKVTYQILPNKSLALANN